MDILAFYATSVKHTLHLNTFSRSSVNSEFTTVGVTLVSDATPASVTAATSAPFLLYDRRGGVFQDDRIRLVVSR